MWASIGSFTRTNNYSFQMSVFFSISFVSRPSITTVTGDSEDPLSLLPFHVGFLSTSPENVSRHVDIWRQGNAFLAEYQPRVEGMLRP
jgi:hypothetical protein